MTMPYACTRCMTPTEQRICPVCGAATENALRIRDALPPQTILNGRYLLGAALGGGGFGVTYRALKLESVEPVRGEMVAVKEYFPHSVAVREEDGQLQPWRNHTKEFTEWRDKFVTEYNMLHEMAHCPSMVQVLDLFQENNTAYLVMEYVEGETIAHRVREKGPIPPDELMAMMQPFIHDLTALHERKIIHRDIKPANIMLREENTPILLDFGSARPNDPQTKKTVLVSKGYAPPEQYDPNALQGNWADVYGLCATLYYALSGIEPTDAQERKYHDDLEHIHKLCPKLNRRQADVLMAGLAMDSTKRPSSFVELEAQMFGANEATATTGKENKENPPTADASAMTDSEETTRTLLAAKRVGTLLKRLAPSKYDAMLTEIERISRMSSLTEQNERVQQLLQESGGLFRLLTQWFKRK